MSGRDRQGPRSSARRFAAPPGAYATAGARTGLHHYSEEGSGVLVIVPNATIAS